MNQDIIQSLLNIDDNELDTLNQAISVLKSNVELDQEIVDNEHEWLTKFYNVADFHCEGEYDNDELLVIEAIIGAVAAVKLGDVSAVQMTGTVIPIKNDINGWDHFRVSFSFSYNGRNFEIIQTFVLTRDWHGWEVMEDSDSLSLKLDGEEFLPLSIIYSEFKTHAESAILEGCESISLPDPSKIKKAVDSLKDSKALISKLFDIVKSPNCSLLLDMNYDEFKSISDDYDLPYEEEGVMWLSANSSYQYKRNTQDGVFDYIFNLAMLESYDTSEAEPSLLKELEEIRDNGYSYILLNQGT